MPNIDEEEKSSAHFEIDKKITLVLSDRPTKAKVELSTSVGRFLEKINYSRLLVAIGIFIIFCAIYFFIATPCGHGINFTEKQNSEDVRWNALYFSIVTFTSLGYGDFSPAGFGKAVASLEVIVGVVSLAILVGKIASERQSTSLLLLMTSDSQRRLRELEQNLVLSANEISLSLRDQDPRRASAAIGQGVSLVASVRKYLTFQAHQAQLAEFGNTSSLRSLYKQLNTYQSLLINSYRSTVSRGMPRVRIEQAVMEIHAIAEVMVKFHPEDLRCKETFLKIGSQTTAFLKLKKSFQAGDVKEIFPTGVTTSLLERVHDVLLKAKFDKNIIGVLSEKLGISRRMAQRCVDELIDAGKFKTPASARDVKRKALFKKLDEKKERVGRRNLSLVRNPLRRARISRSRY